MKLLAFTSFVFIAVLFSSHLLAQPDRYILNGSATRNSCNCYTLTTATQWEAGSVWNKVKIDLNQPFDFTFNVYLGCTDADGADGIVFIMQPISTSIGATGEGMGFSGVQPSIGIALDTWQNTNRNDPAFDHISIQVNGAIDHGNDLAGPVPASATSGNIEDCQWHLLRIVWNPASKWLGSYFDGKLRVEANIDLIKDVFRNDPMVYWGFSAATGGSSNFQQFCTALNPKIESDRDTSCLLTGGNTVTFIDRSESFAPITKYYWDFGDGNKSAEANPQPHIYRQAGIYNVKLAITGKDGCNSDTIIKKIVIGSYPKASFTIRDTCEGANPALSDNSTDEVGRMLTRKWIINGSEEQVNIKPLLAHLQPGTHQLALQVTSEYGCTSALAERLYIVKDRPKVEAVVKDGCIRKPVFFEGVQSNSSDPVKNWHWTFGDGQSAKEQNPHHSFKESGSYKVELWAIGDNSCVSDTLQHKVQINEAIADAGRDTVVLKMVPFTLNGSGNGNFSWAPVHYLNDATVASPVATLNDDQEFLLTVTTPEGCIATDKVAICVFKGSAIYVPNAFTPNNDRLNDLLKPRYIGIKTLRYFSIYNCWGEMLFKTSDLSIGWNGTIKGNPVSSGTYIWVVNAIDFLGKVYQLRGTTTLIR